MPNPAYMYWTPEGDMLFTSTIKGSNPYGKKFPSIKCPNCGKLMYYVLNKDVKNNTLCFDIDNEKYKQIPRNYIRVCSKCHHRIGILKLTPEVRKILEVPQLHECHQKITV